jgi:hypothetical protein
LHGVQFVITVEPEKTANVPGGHGVSPGVLELAPIKRFEGHWSKIKPLSSGHQDELAA